MIELYRCDTCYGKLTSDTREQFIEHLGHRIRQPIGRLTLLEEFKVLWWMIKHRQKVKL